MWTALSESPCHDLYYIPFSPPGMNESILKEFPLHNGLIYLNHAGVSPWPERTSQAVRTFAEENMLQGSLFYPEWVKRETTLRIQARELLNAPSKDDIALLKNTSEALSVVAYGLDWKGGDNVVSSDQEFPSNRIVWESLSQKGVEFRQAHLESGSSPEDALFALVDSRTRLLTVSSVQYSTGLRMNVERIGEFCRKKDILFCIDAIQSLGAVHFDVQACHADFVMADGHKWMLGPEGIALFYSRPEARDRLQLKQFGWHMVEAMGDFDRRGWSAARTARRFECGSPNMLGIHALSASLSLLLEAGMKTIEQEVLSRTEHLFDRVSSSQGLELITSHGQGRYAGIVTLGSTTADNAALYEHLTRHHVVCAFRGGGIRLSPHFYTPLEKIDEALDNLLRFR
ncbi:MAG: aminotransferase class V-fold PLP-dependent enzyme [Nitrospiraceae bacterium]|nr:MAG: aminotransferase class V-fold PLP-dependent enzyme [Nitrospiraceae bacterium]